MSRILTAVEMREVLNMIQAHIKEHPTKPVGTKREVQLAAALRGLFFSHAEMSKTVVELGNRLEKHECLKHEDPKFDCVDCAALEAGSLENCEVQ